MEAPESRRRTGALAASLLTLALVGCGGGGGGPSAEPLALAAALPTDTTDPLDSVDITDPSDPADSATGNPFAAPELGTSPSGQTEQPIDEREDIVYCD